jgi:hypothetical protein
MNDCIILYKSNQSMGELFQSLQMSLIPLLNSMGTVEG